MNSLTDLPDRRRISFLQYGLFYGFQYLSVFLGRTMLTSMAEEEKAATRYYKSVEIQEGDSLWSLAKEYREGGSLSAKEYVEELKKMNNLREDTIHTGQYLTVVYFAEE